MSLKLFWPLSSEEEARSCYLKQIDYMLHLQSAYMALDSQLDYVLHLKVSLTPEYKRAFVWVMYTLLQYCPN